MKSFRGKRAVVTGGGTGMGRELALQLAAEGCSVAICDVSAENMARDASSRCEEAAPPGTRITTHLLRRLRREAGSRLPRRRRRRARDRPRPSPLQQRRHRRRRQLRRRRPRGVGAHLRVCWWGVYYCTRAFLPLLVASPEAYIVNTSSVNGFWASPRARRAAHRLQRGEVRREGILGSADRATCAFNAPHVKVAVVMPGHVGTSIVANTRSGARQAAPFSK